MTNFQSTFKNNIIDINGEKGRKWLESLDEIVGDLAKKWHLSNLQVFPNLTFNYVLSAVKDKSVPVC